MPLALTGTVQKQTTKETCPLSSTSTRRLLRQIGANLGDGKATSVTSSRQGRGETVGPQSVQSPPPARVLAAQHLIFHVPNTAGEHPGARCPAVQAKWQGRQAQLGARHRRCFNEK